MKKTFALFSVVLFLGAAFTSACAGMKSDMIKKKKQKQANLESMAKGKEFVSRGVDYVVMPEIRSKKLGPSLDKPSESRQAKISRMAASNNGSELIEDRGNVIFYRVSSPAFEARSADMKNKTAFSYFQTSGYPVARNKKTGWLGAINGDISVKLRSFGKAEAEALAEDHGLKLKVAFQHIETAFFSVFAGQDIVEVWRALKSDPRVKEADIEVVEHFNRLR